MIEYAFDLVRRDAALGQVLLVAFVPVKTRRASRITHRCRIPSVVLHSALHCVIQDGNRVKTNAFFLADHAEAINGKLYVTGGCWDRIFVPTVPVKHNHLSVVFALVVPWTSTNEKHALEIGCEDAEGTSALPGPLKGNFEVGRPPGWRPGDDATVIGVFHINDLPVTKEGRYSFVLKIDEQEIARTPLTIQIVPAATITG